MIFHPIGLLPGFVLICPEQPPSAKIVSDNQYADQGEEDGYEGEVISHAGQYQANPLIRISSFCPGRGTPLSFMRGVGGEVFPRGADIVGQHDQRKKKEV